jgi:hypothetical protein
MPLHCHLHCTYFSILLFSLGDGLRSSETWLILNSWSLCLPPNWVRKKYELVKINKTQRCKGEGEVVCGFGHSLPLSVSFLSPLHLVPRGKSSLTSSHEYSPLPPVDGSNYRVQTTPRSLITGTKTDCPIQLYQSFLIRIPEMQEMFNTFSLFIKRKFI